MAERTRRVTCLIASALAAALVLGATPAWAASGAPGANAAKPDKKDPPPQTTVPEVAASGSGIIQAIRGRVVLVRELDGRVVHVRIGPRTAVFIDGVRTGIGRLAPGFVVTFSGTAGEATGELRASDPSPAGPRAPVVQSVGAAAVVVTRANGTTRAIAVGPATRILLNGRAATLADLRPGDVLVRMVGKGIGKQPALALRFRRSG